MPATHYNYVKTLQLTKPIFTQLFIHELCKELAETLACRQAVRLQAALLGTARNGRPRPPLGKGTAQGAGGERQEIP